MVTAGLNGKVSYFKFEVNNVEAISHEYSEYYTVFYNGGTYYIENKTDSRRRFSICFISCL